ncbi:MAG: hypothetical protein WC860_04040 [Candidatus Margulisiibacteriota bacterium]|jgi:hypothetical protein
MENLSTYINSLDSNQKNILKSKMMLEKTLGDTTFLMSNDEDDDDTSGKYDPFSSLTGVYDSFDKILSDSLLKDNKTVDLEKSFLNLDKNNDQVIDKDEYASFFSESSTENNSWQDSLKAQLNSTIDYSELFGNSTY